MTTRAWIALAGVCLTACSDADLAGRTDPCPPGEVGCECAESPPCFGDLVCDAQERVCRAPVPCAEVSCSPHRLCAEPGDGRDAFCEEDCEDGWLWTARTSTCTPAPPTCEAGAVTSVLASCGQANRTCVELAGRGRCGGCAEGYVESAEDPGGPCVLAPVCDEEVTAGCTAKGRVCAAGACAECIVEHVEDGDVCVPTTCGGEGVPGGIGEVCAALLRTCDTGSSEGPAGPFEHAVCGECLPRHLPAEEGDACRPVETCASLDCRSKSRLCVPGDAETDATCGACFADHEDLGGRCRPIEGAFCEGDGDLTEACAGDGRLCDPAGPAGAFCGECVEGRVEHPVTGECVEPLDCETLGCETEGRTCEPDPTAVCGGCLPDKVEDAGACRDPLTCGDLSCGRLECAEAPVGVVADARCVTPCRDNQLWNGRECAPCPPCDGEGVTGREARPTRAGWCICQTEPGFFYSIANEVGAVPCDADGDGFVRANARQIIESGDPVLIDNARCDLREIDRVVLHDEAGAEQTFFLDGPLPLYESVRNDDDYTLREEWARAGLPDDAWGPDGVGVTASLINPFTKLCHDPRADYNDNGLADAYEYAAAPLAPGFRPDGQPFNTYAYFAELYRGWFAPLAGDPLQGVWHVAERRRGVAGEGGVPVRYAGDAEWWQECVRRADPAAAAQDPPVGLDFAAEGLTHHSQFKCVVVRDVPDESQPLEMTPAEAANRFEINDCVATEAPVAAESPNPAEPSVSCAPRADPPRPGSAVWGAVPYVAYQANPTHTGYAGGCVNTCAEAMFRHAADANDLLCAGLPANIPFCSGEVADFGRLACHEVPCDQIDNDGDGEIDEEQPLVCPTGLLGVCADGVPRCEGTTLMCDAPTPTDEICDGLDNDCDGTTDEDTGGVPCAAASPSTGLPAEAGLPGVCGVRSTICIEGVLDCLPDAPFEPAGEVLCDGLDNDCDGLVDENLDGVAVPGQPEGVVFGDICQDPDSQLQGACATTAWQCVAGEVVCGSTGEPQPEGCPEGSPQGCLRICDGIDNDCDGETDEDGACLRNWTGSFGVNALLRANDANMGGSRVTMNVGVEFGGQGTEAVDVTMTVEALEQYHTPTEGYIERTRSSAAEGLVAQFQGGTRFSLTYIDGDELVDIIKRPNFDPANNPYEPNVQRVDDHPGVVSLDCNGNVPGTTDVVSADGAYRADRVGCYLNFSIDYTIVPPENPCLGAPTAEVCDGLDNDCDGMVDELDRPIPSRTTLFFGQDTHFGRANRLVAILADGGERVVMENSELNWIRFIFGRIPIGQTRVDVPGNVLQLRLEGGGDAVISVHAIGDQDGRRLPVPGDLRNLRSGQTSERVEYADSLGLGQECGSDMGACTLGAWACQDGAVVCAGGVEPVAEPDACDGVDDDCDGMVDEDIRESCDSTCGRGTRACADNSPCLAACEQRCGVTGYRSCADGAQVYGPCVYDFPAEVCDGVDNDCDGNVDEGFQIDQPCFAGDGQCRVEGVFGCTEDGAVACSALPGEPGEEVCDGADNDCDGMVDEVDAPPADVQEGVCQGAEQVCDGANGFVEPDYSLIADYEDPETSCDGLDNDCDGSVDEADDLEQAPDALMQSGVCRGAEQVCEGANGWVEPDYSQIAGYEATEVTCDDNEDNDCDGQRDAADGDCP